MKYWLFYLIAVATLFHPHLWQKLGMLKEYFTNPEYQFWTTFSTMDFLDLIVHTGLPISLFFIGYKKQMSAKKDA